MLELREFKESLSIPSEKLKGRRQYRSLIVKVIVKHESNSYFTRPLQFLRIEEYLPLGQRYPHRRRFDSRLATLQVLGLAVSRLESLRDIDLFTDEFLPSSALTGESTLLELAQHHGKHG